MMKLKTFWRSVELNLNRIIIHFSEKTVINHFLTCAFLTTNSKLKIWINVKTDQKLVERAMNMILLVFLKTSQPFLSIAVDIQRKREIFFWWKTLYLMPDLPRTIQYFGLKLGILWMISKKQVFFARHFPLFCDIIM